MQYHNYIFLSSNFGLRNLSQKDLLSYKKEFVKMLKIEKGVLINTFTTIGLKVNTNILLLFQSDSLEDIQNHLNKLMHTKLGKYLTITYTLFGMTRPTQYSPKSIGYLETDHKGGKYLIIYPFSKTKEWYQINYDTRRKLMGGHITFGKKHPKINQLLLYSYGVDDNEFIVSYETDDLSDFQTLVMELRSDKVRAYTLKDTPIFTCIHKSTEKILDYI